ncbi:MAG TPA: DUF2510 domain-containing protein [Acidimicrobiales bacterium]|nr:DUF2510 domain-containing protein [Acidimicrobiales bacterium]
MEDVTDSFTQGRGPDDTAPGWYPDRVSPNLQKYWDGTAWIAQRRWIGGKWMSEPPPGVTPDPSGIAAASGTAHGYAAGPYASTSRLNTGSRSVTTPTLTGSAIGLFCFSVLLIVGSFTPWVTVSIASFSASASGTDGSISDLIGVNGWITFAGALLLLILFVLMAVNPEPLYRTLTLIIGVVVAGFAVYDLVRIAQKISQASSVAPTFNASPLRGLQPDINVGWGLIVLVIAALGALVCAVVQARNS